MKIIKFFRELYVEYTKQLIFDNQFPSLLYIEDSQTIMAQQKIKPRNHQMNQWLILEVRKKHKTNSTGKKTNRKN